MRLTPILITLTILGACGGKDGGSADDSAVDGCADGGAERAFYADGDGDGFGDPAQTLQACEAPSGYVDDNTDCDDGQPELNPEATEACDDVDQDCDGVVDEGATSSWYADADADGYGDPEEEVQACDAPRGYVADDTDCDDTTSDVNPGWEEMCGWGDDDCDPSTSERGMVTAFTAEGPVDVTDQFAGTNARNPWVNWVTTDVYAVGFCEGTHYVNIEARADLLLVGMTGDRDEVVLSGAGNGSVLWSETSGVDLALESLTVTDGAADFGAAVRCEDGAIEIVDAVLTDNHAGHSGGAVYGERCSLTLEDAVVSDNSAGQFGGGVAVENTGSTARCSLQDVTLRANAGPTHGGALSLTSCDATLTDTELEGNAAVYSGGAAYLIDGAVSLERVSVTANEAGSFGGGGLLLFQADVEGSDVDFDGNSADQRGGAVNVTACSTLDLTGGSFTNNGASEGSAVRVEYLSAASGAGVRFSGNEAPDIYLSEDMSYSYSGVTTFEHDWSSAGCR